MRVVHRCSFAPTTLRYPFEFICRIGKSTAQKQEQSQSTQLTHFVLFHYNRSVKVLQSIIRIICRLTLRSSFCCVGILDEKLTNEEVYERLRKLIILIVYW